MATPAIPTEGPIHFGPFTLDLDTAILRRDGRRVALTAQPTKALSYLVQHAGRVVLRDELIAHLWPDRVVEYDQSLNFCIRQIRAALGDRPRTPLFIETIPGRGYRFVASVGGGAGPSGAGERTPYGHRGTEPRSNPHGGGEPPAHGHATRGESERSVSPRFVATLACLAVCGSAGLAFLSRSAPDASPLPALRVARPLAASPGEPTDEARSAFAVAEEYFRRGTDPEAARFAVTLYERAAALDPSMAEAHAMLSIARATVARQPGGEGWFDDARRALARAEELEAEAPRVRLAAGHMLLFAADDRVAAREALEAARAGDARDPRALLALAELYRREGEWDEAVSLLEAAFAIDPRHFDTLFELASVHQQRRDYTAAVRYWRRATAIAPSVATSYARFALLPVLSGGDYQGSVHLLRTGIDRRAGSGVASAAYRLAPLMARLDSVSAHHVWIDRGDRGPLGLLARAQILEQWGRPAAAAALYDSVRGALSSDASGAAVAIPPAERDALLALVEASVGDQRRAVELVDRARERSATRRDPSTDAELGILLAMTYARVGDGDRAIAELGSALAVPSSLSPALLRLEPAWDRLRADARFRELADDPDLTLEVRHGGS